MTFAMYLTMADLFNTSADEDRVQVVLWHGAGDSFCAGNGEDAAKNAVETAGRKLRDLRVAEVVKTDMTVKDGKVQTYRTRVLLSFKYES
jgi:flavin-binding protein dodecin